MKREAELKSLQMQINPHFLYNTLETINWMSRAKGNEDIGVMVKSLGDLMRATISNDDYVLLRDEVVNLSNYLNIQKYRYHDKFQAIFNIAEEAGSLYVPKLILQPLVENAIYHGIEPSFEPGIISVSAEKIREFLFIEVMDTGAGMSEETIRSVLDITAEDTSSKNSIELKM
jgi:two-component system sensor histidine kinase YesM